MDVTEKNFETAIKEALLAGGPDGTAQHKGISELREGYGDFLPGGYRKRSPADYDKSRCLIPEDVVDFLYSTQPKEWQKFQQQYGAECKEKLFQRLEHEVQFRGTLDVLRKGFKANGCKFLISYFHPKSGLNADIQRLYEANIFSIVRQLKYSTKNENSLDIVIFLNGLPIFTAELKNPLTGQNVENAVRQYRFDRDPKEPLFAFGRCLAHFAVDPTLVYMTTQLQGKDTRFLPFNQGYGTGAGNPPCLTDFATAYLWKRIWAQDSVLDLSQNFIQMTDIEDENGKKTGKKKLIFPRYHQLDAVRRLVADSRSMGTGQRYLIEHSAGSGKSNSIAWLAHQLASLHDLQDRRVFDSIIVITDRRILDRQLQNTVRQFEQTLGVVENIDKTSKQLQTALEEGRNIIVTTLQKFPYIVEAIQTLPGSSFAVIIDEAHSSQSGESTKSLKTILSGSLEEAEKQETEGEEEDFEDKIVEEMKNRGQLPNVSYFAFTATPKSKTMQLFGTKQPDASYRPFSLYPMRQAIEEKFIMDVLENYTTYKSYFKLLKTIEDDPRFDRQEAQYLLKRFVDLHEHTIDTKVAIMVEHFVRHSMSRINGQAKAMIVTRSRLHAVRYRLAIDKYLKEKGCPFKALVAFSGDLEDGGYRYSEASMNGFPEKQTAEQFKRPEYRILIVANKFQTGFDQPLLHTMYVDKKLHGVHTVQTLSRLNRIHPGKEETMVLDFANEWEDIKEDFEPYYEKTVLTEGTDPNLLYNLEAQLSDYHFFTKDEVEEFAKTYWGKTANQAKLHGLLAPVVERAKEAPDKERIDFRGKLNDYIRLYAFLSQVIIWTDTDLEKLYVFSRYLVRLLPKDQRELPVEIQQDIDMESYRIQKTFEGQIKLEHGPGEISPIGQSTEYSRQIEIEPLSQIIEELNERFGTNFSPADKVFIQGLEERLATNQSLANSVLINTPENARLSFKMVVNDLLQGMVNTNFTFYKKVTDDPEFAKFFLEWLFERYQKQIRDADRPSE